MIIDRLMTLILSKTTEMQSWVSINIEQIMRGERRVSAFNDTFLSRLQKNVKLTSIPKLSIINDKKFYFSRYLNSLVIMRNTYFAGILL